MGKGKYLRKVSTGKKIGRVALIIVLVLVLLIGAVAAFVWSKLGKITYHEPAAKETVAATIDVTEPLATEFVELVTEPVETEAVEIETEPAETLDGENLEMVDAPSYSSGD